MLLAAAIGLFWFSGDSEQIDSLAVLPFENGSADPDAEYFSDGVTESIISSLSQLPNIKVISRNSAFRYKGRTIDAEAVGRELDVEALVLGRIVQRGDELSVSAELVRTRDSGQIWGEQYQLKAADIFSIQENMAREISDALRLQLTSEQEELLTKQFTASSEAYAAYLKGRYHWNRRSEDGARQAIVHFQEAIRQDSPAQERAQLLLDEAGSGWVPTLRACEEGLEVLADDLVEQGSFGLVALVLDGGAPSQDRVLRRDRSKFGAASRLRCGPSSRPR